MPELSIRRVALVVMLAVPTAAAAQQRSLHWRHVGVDARLDSAGALHVIETQEMIFTGAWNGGERRFNVRPGQSFLFEGMERLDPSTGAAYPMTEGDLRRVDEYRFAYPSAVRWRNRLATDPPFAESLFVYRLDFSYGGVLQPFEDEVRLRHEFAFGNRPGIIERLDIHLALDSAWEVPAGFTGEFTATGVGVDAGYVVTLPLRLRSGESVPGVFIGPRRVYRIALVVALFAGFVVLGGIWVVSDRESGRFGTGHAPRATDLAIVEAILHSLPAEAASLAFFGKVTPSAVSAMVARMEAERKLAHRVEASAPGGGTLLFLKLLVPREGLPDDEFMLVDALFDADSSEANTMRIRVRHRQTGLNLPRVIAAGVRKRLDAVPGSGRASNDVSSRAQVQALIGAMIVAGGARLLMPRDAAVFGIAGLWILVTGVVAFVAAWMTRRRVGSAFGVRLVVIAPLLAMMGGLAALLLQAPMTGPLRAGLVTWIVLALLAFAIAALVLSLATPRESSKRLELRRRLLTVRNWAATELTRPKPRVRDWWLPHLLGLGLAPKVDRWFRAFGRPADFDDERRHRPYASTPTERWSSGEVSEDRFTGFSGFGGGGGFSGGGAGGDFGALDAVGSPFSASGIAGSGGNSSSGSSGGGSSSFGSSSSTSSDSSSSSSDSGGGSGGGW